MNCRWQQILACSLALCFVLAGTVAIHPALHRWVEHGGSGHEHNHLGATHSHPHPHVPAVPFGARQSSRSAADALTLFGLQPQDIYRAVAKIFTRASSSENLPHSDSEHTHHSLPQLLAGGLVEGAEEIVQLILQPEPLVWFLSVPESRFAIVAFFAPTAGRGPPAFC